VLVSAQKEFALASVTASWQSVADWVCHDVFGTPARRADDGRRIADRPAANSAALAPQPFLYELPVGTRHMVLWMAEAQGATAWTDDRITASIASAVDEKGGREFIWYRNPKPSVIDAHLDHVQVFWRPSWPAVSALGRMQLCKALASSAEHRLKSQCHAQVW